MKPIIIVIFVCLFVGLCMAQKNNNDPKLIPYELNEKWGFINDKGKIVIELKFDDADKFSEGLARVSIGTKEGFIDSTGKFVIEPKYTHAFRFSEGLAAVAEDIEGEWGYIDKSGKMVIEPRFEHAGTFSNGLAQVMVYISKVPFVAKIGYIDKTGKFVIEPKHEVSGSEDFVDGLAIVAEDKKRDDGVSAYFSRKAFMDKKGNIVTPFFDSAESYSEGLAAVRVGALWGYIDKTGNFVIPPKFDFASSFSEGFAAYGCENDKFGLIDKKGNEITDCKFENIEDFSEGLAVVQVEDKGYGFIDSKGKIVIEPQFSNAHSFYCGLAKVRFVIDDWIYEGYINRKGEYLVKPVKKEEFIDEKIEIE